MPLNWRWSLNTGWDDYKGYLTSKSASFWRQSLPSVHSSLKNKMSKRQTNFFTVSTLLHDSLPASKTPPFNSLTLCKEKEKKLGFFLRQLHSSLLPYPPSLLPPSSTALWERGRGISLRKWRALERLESPVECSRVSGCTSGFLFLQADELIMEKWAWPQ